MVEGSAADTAGWRRYLQADPTPWLLEPANPAARYLTLRYVLRRPEDDPEVADARAGILTAAPAASILAAQWPDGYWVTPDRGYTPRYRATVWQIMFLAQLGAPRDARIERACEFVWQHSRRDDGLFTPHKQPELGNLITLNGNLLWALAHFGYAGHPRVAQVLAALAQLDLTPSFRAGQVTTVVKLARGLAACAHDLPAPLRLFGADAAEFLCQRLPPEPDSQWQQLGFPLAEETDLLEILAVLGEMGALHGSSFTSAIDLVVARQDQQGRWPLDAIPGKMWASFGELGQPSKWVTIRALRVLRMAAKVT